MKADEIRDALKKQPFEPFEVRMGSGDVVPVRHPEFAMVTPTGRVMFVWVDANHSKDHREHHKILDIMHIESIGYIEPGDANGRSTGDAA